MQIMKPRQSLAFILILLTACKSIGGKKAPSLLIAKDTSTPTPVAAPQPKAQLKTHLHDTTYVEGSFILFLLPTEARYTELDSASEESAEADGDFGVGINNTLDSLKSNPKYKDIKGLVSTNRYINIKDCLGGPLVIDRDTVNYGFIMSATGKNSNSLYNSVHSGDYLEEINSYFIN